MFLAFDFTVLSEAFFILQLGTGLDSGSGLGSVDAGLALGLGLGSVCIRVWTKSFDRAAIWEQGPPINTRQQEKTFESMPLDGEVRNCLSATAHDKDPFCIQERDC